MKLVLQTNYHIMHRTYNIKILFIISCSSMISNIGSSNKHKGCLVTTLLECDIIRLYLLYVVVYF